MSRRKTQEEFLADLERVHEDNITTDDRYVGSSTKMTFTCSVCHTTWMASPNNILRGSGCPKCSYIKRGRDKALSQSEFLEKLKKVHGDNIITGDVYVNNYTKMRFMCNVCGNTWKSDPSSLLRGCNCPRCAKKEKKTNEQFLIELSELHGDTIKAEEEYITNKTKIKFRCMLCNTEWMAIPDSILRGSGCPNCASSSGEQVVRAILEFNNIDYDPQHSFKLRGKTHRLDFVLRNISGTWCVIQPDGIQHTWVTKQIATTGKQAEKIFNDRVSRDKDENVCLTALGIRVLRIPWFWFDIDNTFVLLQDFLGYDLKKPDKDYIPMYKRFKEMAYAYLDSGDIAEVTRKYKVPRRTVSSNFKRYFGVSRPKYVKAHPEFKIKKQAHNITAVLSISSSGIIVRYNSQKEASLSTGISVSSINMCLRGHNKTAGGLHWQYA